MVGDTIGSARDMSPAIAMWHTAKHVLQVAF
jgi:hypothetical protein